MLLSQDLQTASNYLQFVDSFFKIVPSEAKDSIVSFHVDIPEPQFELFQSAIGYHTTEFATIAPKEGFDKSILEPGLNRMISHSSSRGACWGPITEEDGKQAVFYIGWSSLQVSIALIAFQEIQAQIHSGTRTISFGTPRAGPGC